MCDHDWRVNPYTLLMSDPPQRQLVCAKCSATGAQALPAAGVVTVRMQSDPKTWPRAESVEPVSDEERYKRAYTAYWAMMALNQRAFDALPEDRKQQYRQETARLRKILTELGPKLRDQQRAMYEHQQAED